MASTFLKELTQFNIGSAFKSLLSQSGSFSPNFVPSPIPIDPATRTTPNGEDGWMFESWGNGWSYFKYESYASCVDAYRRCPPVSAIINRKAQAFVNGKTFILDKDGKESTSSYANDIRKLLANPNPLQTQIQFEAQGYIFEQLFGFNIILKVTPFGYNMPKYMWNVPASWIDWDRTAESFGVNGGVAISILWIKFNGKSIPFKIEDLIIVRDFTPSFDEITFPASKICGMAQVISNIIGALESRGMLINYRGALGILTQDPGRGQFAPVAMSAKQKEELQEDFRRYGLRRGQWSMLLTTASLKYQQMGYPTRELMLIEEVQEDSKSLCDGLNFPPHLLGLIDPSFNNQTLANKALYQDSIIPDANNYYSYYNALFQSEKNGINIIKDYTHIPSLQEDQESLGRARSYLSMALDLEWKNGWLTLNRVLELLGEDTIDGGDIYYNEWLSKNPNNAVVQVAAPPAKILQVLQGRNPNGQWNNGLTAIWDSITPGGTNLNGNGKH